MIYHLLWRRFLGIFHEGRRLEGYIPQKNSPTAGGIVKVFTDCHDMSNFDEVYILLPFP